MKKRWALGIPAIALIATCMFMSLVPADPISKASFHRIKKGMTRHQVEEILRGPSHKWVTFVSLRFGPGPNEYECWNGKICQILIHFDSEDLVVDTKVVDVIPELSILDIVRSWLP